jgi:hypothetical protein
MMSLCDDEPISRYEQRLADVMMSQRKTLRPRNYYPVG